MQKPDEMEKQQAATKEHAQERQRRRLEQGAWDEVVKALEPFHPEERGRILRSVEIFYGMMGGGGVAFVR